MKGTASLHKGELTPRERELLLECITNEIRTLKMDISKETSATARRFLGLSLECKEHLLSKIGGW